MSARHKTAPGVRTIAARVLVQVVFEGRSLTEALPGGQSVLTDSRDVALLQELCFGTLRWYFSLEALLHTLLRKPLKSRDADLHCLLLTGLYQLEHLALPQRVAVHETVQASRELDKDWASGLVNAVLRNQQRRKDGMDPVLASNPEARYAHPAWLIDLIKTDWPDDWAAILDANNARPPFSLRINQQRLTRDEYLERLSVHAIAATAIAHVPHGIFLEKPLPVTALPGFQGGDISVQDGAAQLAAGLLQLAPGLRVLDACAAPGGKTAHILESEPAVQITAMDIDARRLQRIEAGLSRLSLQATRVQGDAGKPDEWWDGQLYDRILLDVPCSATGVIRRHPDIKILRRQDDIAGLRQQQVSIMDAMWPLLAPGGMLLYCTCSVLAAENSEQVRLFLERWDDAEEVGIDAGWGRSCRHGRQIFPGEDSMDGFYFACLCKNSK